MKTASARAAEINATFPDRAFTLVEDVSHWDGYGIHTGAELDKYLAEQHYEIRTTKGDVTLRWGQPDDKDDNRYGEEIQVTWVPG